MDDLLNPITQESPCGEYLKGNRSLYRSLRNSFNQAQSSYRQLMESPDSMADEELISQNAENWLGLAELCKKNLLDVSKDTEILCWLSTAQLFTSRPLENLDNTLSDFFEVLKVFWDDLNPKPPVEKLKSSDAAGQAREWVEVRIQPLIQLVGETERSGQLFMPLQSIDLIGNISLSQYLSEERAGKKESLKLKAEKELASSHDEIVNNIINLGRISNRFKEIEAFISDKCQEVGAAGISFKHINQLLKKILDALHYLLSDQINPWPLGQAKDIPLFGNDEIKEKSDTPIQNKEDIDKPVRVNEQLHPSDGIIYTRTQAFHELRRISDYFSRTEPHSPVYMLLERAIRWGQLSLPELIAEMVGDNAQVMQRIHHLAGLESIEKTAIPEAIISSQDLAFRQPVSLDSQVDVEHPAGSTLSDGVVERVSSEKVTETENKNAGMANFEW